MGDDVIPSTSSVAWKNIKENPIKSITGVIAIITFIIGSIFWIDSRYVHAGDMVEYQIVQEKKDIREKENTIFEYSLKEQMGVATDVEKVMKNRLQQQVADMKQNVRDLGGNVD
jgi:hypothetical protein